MLVTGTAQASALLAAVGPAEILPYHSAAGPAADPADPAADPADPAAVAVAAAAGRPSCCRRESCPAGYSASAAEQAGPGQKGHPRPMASTGRIETFCLTARVSSLLLLSDLEVGDVGNEKCWVEVEVLDVGRTGEMKGFGLGLLLPRNCRADK